MYLAALGAFKLASSSDDVVRQMCGRKLARDRTKIGHGLCKRGRVMVYLLKIILLVVVVFEIPAAPVAARADSTADARAEAKKHYERAMELNEDGQAAEAVIELKRAYELAPHHTVLYNLGQAYITLAKPVEAVAALQRYLDEGGKAIKPDRRAEVETEIARQKTHIATLQIRGLPAGARVRVNGVDVGTAPFGKPISVGVGDHVVSATADGYDPAEVKVTVAGEDRRIVELKLRARSLQAGCRLGYHDGGAGICVASGGCSANYHNDGNGACVVAGCAPSYLRVGAQCLPVFRSVSPGGRHACGVRTDHTVSCWGRKGEGQATPPTGRFLSVSAGRYHTCGVNSKGAIACWGSNYYGQSTPPAGTFAFISAGGEHTCGVRSGGTIACWGYDADGEATPPQGTFTAVSACNVHTCGLRTDGTIACWGGNEYGQATPPTGIFTSVSAGGAHSCGLRPDGSVICWGDNEYGQATPPTGIFASIGAGGYHTCGVRTDSTVACWGSNKNGEATPHAGKFVSVRVGYGFTCGIARDGTAVCWGDNTYGQATPPAM